MFTRRLSKMMVASAAMLAATGSAISALAEPPVYITPTAPGVSLDSILTSGDFVGSYQVMGTPDGLGALRNGNLLTVLTNQELSVTNSVVANRLTAGGKARGSLITQLTYNVKTGKVVSAKDFLTDAVWFDYATGKYGSVGSAPAGATPTDQYGTPNHSILLNRFCSSTLAPAGTFYDAASDLGYADPVYLTGEEGGDESRAFVASMDGQLVQFPRMGLAAWENLKPIPTGNKVTAVLGSEDGSAIDSQLWMYVGEKTANGKWYEKAGFTNGSTYVLASTESTPVNNDNEVRTKVGKNSPIKVRFSRVENSINGRSQNFMANQVGIEFARIEDGHFDPMKPNDFYFVTTESNKDPKATSPNPSTPTIPRDGGALWRLRFVDVANPLKGATLTMLLDGTESPYLNKPDNITVDTAGNILIQEDPGNNAHISRIIAYRLSDGRLSVIAKFRDELFTEGSAGFITKDEESSGIIDVTNELRKGTNDKAFYYMLVAQVHSTPTLARPDMAAGNAFLPGSVEGGQWYVMKVSSWQSVFSQ